ncbi:MAG: hypothetical protein AAB853_00440 [Patescibacteria group bacterium]
MILQQVTDLLVYPGEIGGMRITLGNVLPRLGEHGHNKGSWNTACASVRER